MYFMRAKDHRNVGRNALAGNWGSAILVTFVASLLGAGGGMVYTASSLTTQYTYNADGYSYNYSYGFSFSSLFSNPVITIGFIFMLISFLVVLIFGGAIQQGLCLYNIRLVTGQPQKPFSSLFERFKIFGKAFLLQFVTGIFIFLWSLLFIIPGIVAAYRYSMAPYIMAHNPEIGVMDAIRMSKEMMKGHKGDLFVLQLSFFGWMLLAGITCGIGSFFLAPYINASVTSFYLNLLQGQQQGQQQASVPNGGAYGAYQQQPAQPGQQPYQQPVQPYTPQEAAPPYGAYPTPTQAPDAQAPTADTTPPPSDTEPKGPEL